MSKVGPIGLWLLYLLGCHWVAPEVLPFIMWALVVAACIWVIVHQMQIVSNYPAHRDVLYNKKCWGWVTEVSRRKVGDNKVEISKQCTTCKTMFFETEEVEHAPVR